MSEVLVENEVDAEMEGQEFAPEPAESQREQQVAKFDGVACQEEEGEEAFASDSAPGAACGQDESLEQTQAPSSSEASEEDVPSDAVPNVSVDEDDAYDEYGFPKKDIADLSTRELGQRGEEAAVRFLQQRGFRILERNWTCHYGEADIIAYDTEEDALCFIEVKTRRGIKAGLPEEAVTEEKRRRYERIAMSYLVESSCDDEMGIRFDVIGICATDANRALLRHHRGAFSGRTW